MAFLLRLQPTLPFPSNRSLNYQPPLLISPEKKNPTTLSTFSFNRSLNYQPTLLLYAAKRGDVVDEEESDEEKPLMEDEVPEKDDETTYGQLLICQNSKKDKNQLIAAVAKVVGGDYEKSRNAARSALYLARNRKAPSPLILINMRLNVKEVKEYKRALRLYPFVVETMV
ncbi:hypothetical protein V6N12_047028 [Hibiscus sabdariffa]|uniref:Uncharacterized protein n=1 Tax=Hibiscus sabdariffa TaxID=183260 RepID=A0ABR2AUC0_9ROSI